MMTLEEAIKHCKDVALSCTNKECALEHFQLLKWLQEYSNMLEKQGEQNQKHFELKAGHWYICHRAFCCRADHLTVKEGERFMCEKDGIVKGFVIKEPEKYFKEVCAPAPIEDEQKPVIEMKSAEESLGIDSDTYNKIVDECFGEQKPAWNEEDEHRLKDTIYFLDTAKKHYASTVELDVCIDWLKSLKDRVQPQTHYAWSEEEIEKAAQEWDSKANFKPFYISPTGVKQDITTHKESFKAGINWILKSLRHQSHWKPSDEQIYWLKWATGRMPDTEKANEAEAVLEELLEQLKKLREE